MRSDRINFLASVTAAAGLVGFIGVFADWFKVQYPVSGGEIVIGIYGSEDGTGAVALAAGLGALMFGAAYILLQDPQIRRVTALLMVICCVALLVSSAIGFTRVDDVVGPNPVLPGVETTAPYEATISLGLAISFLSGLIGSVASILLVSRREQGLEEDVPST